MFRRVYWVTFSLIAFVSVQANPGADHVSIMEMDLSQTVHCEAPFQSEIGRIHLEEVYEYNQRALRVGGFFKQEGYKNYLGDCQFKNESYICRWGFNSYLELYLSESVIKKRGLNEASHLVRGKVKSGLFQREHQLICRLDASLEWTEPEENQSL